MSDASLNDAMDATRRLATLARSAREDGGIRVRQPLAAMQVAVPAAIRGEAFDECLELLAREVNVKRIDVVESDADLVTLRGRPNFRTLGKVYGRETPRAAAAAQTLDPAELRTLETGGEVTLDEARGGFTYRPEDVVVEREVASSWLVQSDGPYVVALDPRIPEALRQEGTAREIVNRIQRLRKEAGYEYTTRIRLGLSGDDDVLASARGLATFIAGETLARELEVGQDIDGADLAETVDLDGRALRVSMVRVEDASPSVS